MNDKFAAAMRKATLCTRATKLVEATRVIQNALSGYSVFRGPSATDTVELPAAAPPIGNARSLDAGASHSSRKPLGKNLQLLREGRLANGGFSSLVLGPTGAAQRAVSPPMPEGAQFLDRSFTCVAGTRGYKLYIPSRP